MNIDECFFMLLLLFYSSRQSRLAWGSTDYASCLVVLLQQQTESLDRGRDVSPMEVCYQDAHSRRLAMLEYGLKTREENLKRALEEEEKKRYIIFLHEQVMKQREEEEKLL
jgi:hypothetical protein